MAKIETNGVPFKIKLKVIGVARNYNYIAKIAKTSLRG